MQPLGSRRAFLGFHLTLGIVVLVQSVHTALWAAPFSTHAGGSWHLFVLATVEALGALLFLLPRTLYLGGLLLLSTFAVALVAHAMRGELLSTLLVYAAGTLFVMAHGSVWPPGASACVRGVSSE